LMIRRGTCQSGRASVLDAALHSPLLSLQFNAISAPGTGGFRG
jgi:hypothetical protein